MKTEIVRLAPQHLGVVRRFAEKVWQRPRSEAFYRWRYLEPSFLVGCLALRGDECLAMELAIRRPYRVGDERVDLLEVFDWYCLPELRNSGLGIRVMHGLMKEPHPCLLMGGSEDTRGLLPRLRWQGVATAQRFILPLGVERTAAALRERARLPEPAARALAAAALRLWFAPRRARAPGGGRAIAVASVGDEVQSLYRGDIGYGTVPLWSPELLRWLIHGFPGAGLFLPLYFARGERIVGWSLVRIYPSARGCDAELIEAFAPHPDPELYAWMVSEVAQRAAAFSPGVLGANTTCPILQQALRANRFRVSGDNPVHVWWPDRQGLPGPMAIGSNSGDSPIVPFVESWWDPDREAPA